MQIPNIDEYKFKLTVETPSGKSIEVDSFAYLRVNESEIKEELKQLPIQYMLFASTYAKYKERLDFLESELEQIKNEATKRIRREWNDENGKLTNKLIEEMLVDDPEILVKTKEFVMLRTTTNQLYYFCKALDKKFYTLKTLSFISGQGGQPVEGEDTETDIDIDIHKYEKNKGITNQ